MHPPEKKYPRHSWTLDSEYGIAIKKTDHSFFNHNGSGLPVDIRQYFSAEDIPRGGRKNITLMFEGDRYPAHIERESMDLARTRIFWRVGLGEAFRSSFPGYEDYTKDDYPSLIFEKSGPDEYRIHFMELEDEAYESALDLETWVHTPGDAEGKRTMRYTHIYERSRKNREAAVAIHGTRCMVCGFSFEEKYGDVGRGFVEVHHTVPLSEIDEEIAVDPATDLVCVCSNCHRMIHRKGSGVFTLEELRVMIRE